ncbi:MAG: ACT domain-containing protein, partial [Gammaproteobacteria bacterium]
FETHAARDIVIDLTLTHRFMHNQLAEEDKALEPVVAWHNEPDRGYTTAKICTWDRAGLFSKIAGSFAAAGINILNAQIFTRNDGIVLDTFYVTDARTGSLVNRGERELFESTLGRALVEDELDFRALIARQKTARPPYQALEGERIPTQIRIDNDTSANRTILEIETEDHVGLLHVISQALSELNLDISLAKISTEKGAAIDTFYVCEHDGQKIVWPERQQLIEERLRAGLTAAFGS